MSNSASLSKRVLYIAIACTIWVGSCVSASPLRNRFLDFQGYAIIPALTKTEKSDWAEYFYNHLKNRVASPSRVKFNKHLPGYYEISVNTDPTLLEDFCIQTTPHSARISARDRNVLIWLMYQAIKAISNEDSTIESSDLPPALINISDTCGWFAFSHRSIYTPMICKNNEFSPIIGCSNIDTDWGIWGHGLLQVLKEGSESVFATINGIKNKEQLCFSSEDSYRKLEQYICYKYGEGEKQSFKFALFPADNSLVCTCDKCRLAGNTSNSATPAVTGLLIRLARRFPRHFFYTSAYLSTKEIPRTPLPVNAGIIISAIDFPLKYKAANELENTHFAKIISDCKRISKQIIVWDYISNFDDYLTPFPILNIMQQRLQLYRKMGVPGVFLNGSGYDYSTFSDMQSFVLSALLINPDVQLNNLVKRYFRQYYPNTNAILSSFYLGLEQKAMHSIPPLNIYGGINDAKNSFLDIHSFIQFYNGLKEYSTPITAEEKKRIEQISISLSFTRLEIARSQSFREFGIALRNSEYLSARPEAKMWLAELGRYNKVPDLMRYRESGGKIDNYLSDWNTNILPSATKHNILLAQRLTSGNLLDEDYSDLSVLCDGISGLTDNYHGGWLLYSGRDLGISLPTNRLCSAKHISITFMEHPSFRITPPLKIEIYKNRGLYKVISHTSEVDKKNLDEKGRIVEFIESISVTDTDSLSVHILNQDNKRSRFAIDEIRLTP